MIKPVTKYRIAIFFLTFLSYATYTLTRLPASTTKATMMGGSSNSTDPDIPKIPAECAKDEENSSGGGYEPFKAEDNGSTLLGADDTAFLTAYAVGLFISGGLGDRLNLRWMIGIGMLGAGTSAALFGLGGVWGIHFFPYYLFMNILAGLFQSTGWPACVTVVSRWYGHKTRGAVMGIWNAHSNVGNILGKVISTAALAPFSWQGAWIIPGCICGVVGLIELLFLMDRPQDVLSAEDFKALQREVAPEHHHHHDHHTDEHAEEEDALAAASGSGSGSAHAHDRAPLVNSAAGGARSSTSQAQQQHTPQHDDDQHHYVQHDDAAAAGHVALPLGPGNSDAGGAAAHADDDQHQAISFCQALLIPGVIANSLCLFFSKLVTYAFLFWLPLYLSTLDYCPDEAGNISTVFDVGGIVGGILAGVISDKIGMRGIVSLVMLLLTIPVMEMFNLTGNNGMAANVLVMFFLGMLVNGPYTLISSAVAADLGQHKSLKGNPKAMSTVTGIIDGTGSAGSAIQGLAIGLVSKHFGWTSVFYALMVVCFLSAACLVPLVIGELRNHCAKKAQVKESVLMKEEHHRTSQTQIQQGSRS